MARISKEEAKMLLADVPGEYVFWCRDGLVFRNMKELRDGLANMSDETYAYHANKDKNDFSKWVGAVIKDEKLAAELQNVASRAEAAKRVDTRVTVLSRR